MANHPKTKNQRLNGLFPLSYLGVNPVTPADFILDDRAPTQNDYAEFSLGDIWLDTSSLPTPPVGEDIYMLVDKSGGIATWVNMGGSDILTLTGDTGGAVSPDVNGNINVPGAHGINTAGNPGTNTVTFAINNAITLGDLANLAAGVPALTIATGDITFTATNNVGNLNMVNTHTSGNSGVIEYNSNRYFHNYFGSAASGHENLFAGKNAGNFTLNGAADDARNTGLGESCLQDLTTATLCTAVGADSQRNVTTGRQNTSVGVAALDACTTGERNSAFGVESSFLLSTGSYNLSFGQLSLHEMTTGSFNIAMGSGEDTANIHYCALGQLLTGSWNIAIGSGVTTASGGAGLNYTGAESSNIVIGPLALGTTGESNTIRIGSGTAGAGNGEQNRCFITGIRGVTTGVADAIPVLIDSAQQLGTVSSSIRYKENVKNMDSESDGILQLQPVTFFYKTQEHKKLQYGLIAEDVETIFPGLVVHDKEGLPTSVKYHDLPVLLLNELKKLYTRVAELEARIDMKDHYD